MPPKFGVSAPKCPRCHQSVYIAEQAIGPNSTPYHKSCLVCTTCGKRLDSTLLVEHEGLPLCKNCHRSHLGQGKGGFAKAVPVRATLPSSPPNSPSNRNSRSTGLYREEEDERDTIARLTGISISSRQDNAGRFGAGSEHGDVSSRGVEPDRGDPHHTPQQAVPGYQPTSATHSPMTSRYKPVSSLDALVSSGSPLPRITARSAALSGAVNDLQDSMDPVSEHGSRGAQGSPPAPLPVTSERTAARQPKHDVDTLSRDPAVDLSVGDASQYADGEHTAHASPSRPTQNATGLPPPARRAPVSSQASGYKTASGLSQGIASPPQKSSSGNGGPPSVASSPFRNQYTSPATTPTRLANAIGSGTSLCARCAKPAYFAEAVHGATTGGRVWHRACLKCEGCGATLQKGSIVEGPGEEAKGHGQGMNTFCKVCYKRHFGPKGIGSAGMSFPTPMSR